MPSNLQIETGRMTITTGLDEDGDFAWQFDIEEIELVPAIGMLTGVLDKLRSQLGESFVPDDEDDYDVDLDDNVE